MSTEDDFSPIVDRGEVAAASGLRSRFGRRGDAPVASESGISRVFINSDGQFISEGSLSAGERYWGRLQGWVKVDISPHTLKFKLPVADPSGRGDFIAQITVIASVIDPAEAAHAGLKSVREFVEPVLGMKLGTIELGGDSQRAGMSMAQLRADTTRRISAGLAEQPLTGLPAGIGARVASVTVTFDESTSTHLAGLTKLVRQGDLVDAEHAIAQKNTEHDIQTRKAWRDALGDLLTDPQRRVIELVAADPSPQTIAQVIQQSAALEAANRDSFVSLLNQMIDKDYVERGDPLYDAAVSLLHSLQDQAHIPMVETTPRPGLERGTQEDEDSADRDPPTRLREA